VRRVEYPALKSGQARLRIDRVALTNNNVTYARLGDQLEYWKFFPAPENWGHVPAWGFAEVVESSTEAVSVGERLFGFWPMSTYATLEPVRDGDQIVDRTEHRRGLPGMYNSYLPVPSGDTRIEEVRAVVGPLFGTAWLLADYLAGQDYRGAATVLISSASSKVAAATAWCLARRDSRPELVGLTSPRHVDFVTGLGTFDHAVVYDEVASAKLARPVVLVDIAGNAAVSRAVRERCGADLVWQLNVGDTHPRASGSSSAVDEPAP
ncbi:DUF2855 family protein, partial [Nocardia gipuzkoensis]